MPPKKRAVSPAKPSAASPGIADTAVVKATGQSWAVWLKRLDAAGGRQSTHKEIVAILRDRYGLGPWWQQMITVGYERARGLREKHQVASGFTANASRTIAVPVEVLFDAWQNATRRRRWLADSKFQVRTALSPRSLRVTWVDGTSWLNVQFIAKGAGRSTVTIAHERLKSSREVAEKKIYWRGALAALKELLEV